MYKIIDVPASTEGRRKLELALAELLRETWVVRGFAIEPAPEGEGWYHVLLQQMEPGRDLL